MTDKIVRQTDVDDRYMNNFQAIFFKKHPRGGDVTSAGEIWGSFDNPRESMTPTESVTFHKIWP